MMIIVYFGLVLCRCWLICMHRAHFSIRDLTYLMT